MTAFSLRTLNEHVDWFRRYLAARSVVPATGSAFAKALGRAERLAQMTRDVPSTTLPDDKFVRLVRDAMGTDYMIQTFRHAERWLDALDPSDLTVFRGPDVNLLRDGLQSKDRDVAWELLVGAIASSFAKQVELEEPDVRCRFENARWGLAAKLLYSTNRQQHIKRIVEGAKQIEDADVDLGLVVVNGSNLLNHDEFFSELRPTITTSFDDPRVPTALLTDAAKGFFARIDSGSLLRRLTQDGNGEARLKTRGILFFLQAVTRVKGAATIMTVCHFFKFRELLVGEETFWKKFHAAAQGLGFAAA